MPATSIEIPPHSLVIPQSAIAVAHLTDFLRGRPVPSEWHDLHAVVEDTRGRVEHAFQAGHAFRAQYLKQHCPKPAGKRRPQDFLTAAEQAPWNPPTAAYLKQRHLVPNTNIIDADRLDTLKRALVEKLLQLRQYFARQAPITVIDYFDDSDEHGCFTTAMLTKTLRSILGDRYEDFVFPLRANFRSRDNPMVNRFESYLRRLQAATANGGIVIAGGTFCDADDVHGQWFRENVMRPFLKNSLIRALLVCWSYQVMARALAEESHQPREDKENEGVLDLHVFNGALHFGTFPVEVLTAGPLKHMFITPKRIATMTAAFTHSDWLVSPNSIHKVGDEITGGAHKEWLKVIAFDPLTKQPCGYLTPDGRIVGVAFHPEVNLLPENRGTTGLADDLEAIRTFVNQDAIQMFLEERYNVSAGLIADNFVPRDAHGHDLVQRDIGQAFYTSVLTYFADSLLRTFRKSR